MPDLVSVRIDLGRNNRKPDAKRKQAIKKRAHPAIFTIFPRDDDSAAQWMGCDLSNVGVKLAMIAQGITLTGKLGAEPFRWFNNRNLLASID